MEIGRDCGTDGSARTAWFGHTAGSGETNGAGSARLEPGIGLFWDEEGSTTLAAAVAILVSIALLFGLASSQWVTSRAADVQVVADAGALAGANVVACYATAVQVLDAIVLSMGLIGMATLAIGLVLSAIPLVDVAGPPVVSAALSMLEAREGFSVSAAKGLATLEEIVPLLVAVNSMATVKSNDVLGGHFVGVAIPFPLEGSSRFGAVDGASLEELASDSLDASAEMDEAEREAAQAKAAADDAVMRGWLADCGDTWNMMERADTLAGLSGALNPDYPTVIGWGFEVGVLRARSYYRARYENESSSLSSDPEEMARSAARRAFYAYALEQVEQSSFYEDYQGTVYCDIARLPKNTQDVRGTHLYTDVVWPCTQEASGAVLHCSSSCPGATGPAAGRGSFQQQDAGVYGTCPVCQFTVVDVGRASSPTSLVASGFEYHWNLFVDAAEDYAEARNAQSSIERQADEAARRAEESFRKALEGLAAVRAELCPPGRHGIVCVVVDPSSHYTPSVLLRTIGGGAELPPRVAVSAAVLAGDQSGSQSNVLSGFFDELAAREGAVGAVSAVLDGVMGAWGSLLASYGDGYRAFSDVLEASFSKLAEWGMGSVSAWLRNALGSAVSLMGIQPADLTPKKPVLANSSSVMSKSGNDWYMGARALVEAICEVDPDAGPVTALRAVGVFAEAYTGERVLKVATFTIPGTSITIPIEIDLGWLQEFGDAA